jgi:putative transposase
MKTTDVLQEDVPNLVRESDSVSLSEADWALAKKRFASLSPLFDLRNVPKKKAREASLQLGIDSRTVYRMISRFRASGGLLSSLIRRASSGGAGKGRLSDEVEAII